MGCGSSQPVSVPSDKKVATPEELEVARKKEHETAEALRKKKEEEEEALRKKEEEEAIAKKKREEEEAAEAKRKLEEQQERDRLAEEQRLRVQRENDLKRKLELENKKKFQPYLEFVGPGEAICMSNLFEKQSGNAAVGFQPRQLILTNKPKLYYVDMNKREVKGTIDWTEDGATPIAKEEVDKTSMSIIAKSAGAQRAYIFRIPASQESESISLATWVMNINEAKKILQGK